MNKQEYLNKLNIRRPKNAYNYKYDLLPEFFNWSDKLQIGCLTHGTFSQTAVSHLYQHGCQKCTVGNKAVIKELINNSFINKSKTKYPNKFSYKKTELIKTKDKVIITCNKHGDFSIVPKNHFAGNGGCLKCHKFSKEDFIEKARTVHGDKYNYDNSIYVNSKKPLQINCFKHGAFWQQPNGHVSSGSGCHRCIESSGEKEVELILKEYNLNFIREYKIFPNKYRFDFYLPEYNIFIEFNGKQHYSPVSVFGGIDSFKRQQRNDIIKKHLVKNNGGHLIVITYLQQKEKAVKREICAGLKRVYNYWFKINNKLCVYKSKEDVCKAYKLPLEIKNADIIKELEKVVPGFQLLF